MLKRMLSRAAILLLAFPGRILAAEVAVPPDLQPWQGWVLQGEEYRRCPFITGNQAASEQAFQCIWPERLALELDARGGRFTQRWELFAESWITLPGDLEHWPRDVQLDGARAVVVARNGVPQIRLAAGAHTVSGSFRWTRRPESLAVPPQAGIIALSIDGQAIAQPERAGSGLWLGRRRGPVEQQQLDLQVYRLLSDDIPAMLTTEIRVQAAGEAREELLAPVLPTGFVPVSLASALPARVEPDGRLRVQVRAGNWQIRISARGAGVAQGLRRPAGEGQWPSDEIWSFEALDRLRVAGVEGVESIDPGQANVPAEWRQFPSYRVGRDAELKVIERSRGLATTDDNQLSLSRALWFDFKHQGFTAVDSISGSMRQDWRLDMVEPYRLLSARVGEENLLVTKGAKDGATGIEVRSPEVHLQAVSHIAAGSAMPATGWQGRFTNVQGMLHLPPGHRLVAALGADSAPGAWIESWRLLDMFLVLIASLAIGRLLGWRIGLLALGGLALTHHDSNGMIWLWVNFLVALVLAREAPAGRLRMLASIYRAVSAAILVIALVPFIASQARLAIYPQLDAGGYYMPMTLPAQVPVAEAPPPQAEAPASATEELERKSVGIAGRADKAARLEMAQTRNNYLLRSSLSRPTERYAPGTLLQAGPGIPEWQFIAQPYSWSGPVDAGQKVRFLIATPFWLSLWRLVGIALLAVLLMILVRFAYGWPQRWPQLPRFGASTAAALVACAALGALATPGSARAALPDATLLNDLKARLTRAPECMPNCAEINAASVIATPQQLEIELEVSALTPVAVPVPAASGRWEPETISVDGQPNGGLFRDAGQRLWVPLRAGAHVVRLSGRIVAAESVQVVFPQQPRSIEARGDGWEISGVSDERLLTNTLELVRKMSAGQTARIETSMQFAPFVRVMRRVTLGLDWTISTAVERLAPEKGAFTVKVPLLAGESVLTEGVEVADGNAQVAMPAGESIASWASGLARAEQLTLKNSTDAARTEIWQFDVSPEWNARFEGTPAVLPEQIQDSWTYEYHPRSGEALTVRITRPEAAEGATLAIDGVSAEVQVGKRSTDTSLNVRYRSTQGGRHVLHIPPDAHVRALQMDGQSMALRPEQGELAIALLPGAHQLELQWQSDSGVRVRTRAPAVDLGSPSSNIHTQLTLPEDRWILYAMGPGVGPAILFWGELLVFVVIALALGRSQHSPLRVHEWLLLGLGLSTFSWSVLLLFAVWIFAMHWRSRWAENDQRRTFNLIQVALGLLSVVALFSLVSAIPYGLLSTPDMRVRGAGSGGNVFSWFVDQATGVLPQPGVISVSLWWYKIAMLAWALWLSSALLRWLPWGWRAFNAGGLWRPGRDRHEPATPKVNSG
ncbi:MAG TPA: hypothetical protein VKB41_03270 [Steroidobacteraceae bacterium]|nr:hypothetical protein [Steroidobacteraceae bacterium]